MEELISYHDDKNNTFFSQLVNTKQKGLVAEHIQQFQKLSLRVEGIADDKVLDLFIGTLKDNIQHEVCIFEPASLEKAFMVARKVESKNLVMDTRRTPLTLLKIVMFRVNENTSTYKVNTSTIGGKMIKRSML